MTMLQRRNILNLKKVSITTAKEQKGVYLIFNDQKHVQRNSNFYFLINLGKTNKYKQDIPSIQTKTINVNTIINSIESTNIDSNDLNGLFIYLYVMYANYSKTWIERVVKDDATGNSRCALKFLLSYQKTILLYVNILQ